MHTAANTQPAPPSPASYTVAQAAKMLGMGERRLFNWLRAQHMLDTNNLPYQKYIDAGYFRVHRGSYNHPVTGTHYYARTNITAHGMTWLAQKMEQQHETIF